MQRLAVVAANVDRDSDLVVSGIRINLSGEWVFDRSNSHLRRKTVDRRSDANHGAVRSAEVVSGKVTAIGDEF